jgi:putative spermidine/putrescine transport system ATP-binding protein
VTDQASLQVEVLRDHPAKVGDTIGICIPPDRLMAC